MTPNQIETALEGLQDRIDRVANKYHESRQIIRMREKQTRIKRSLKLT